MTHNSAVKFTNEGRMVLNPEPETIRLIAVGDIIPGGRTEKYFRAGMANSLISGIMPVFSSYDISLFNLETPLTNVDSPISKCGTNFKCNPETVEGLKFSKINIAALANNHIYDQGREGLENTFSILDTAGILWHGAGCHTSEMHNFIHLEINETHLTFLNIAEGEFSGADVDGETGGAAPISPIHDRSTIKKAKSNGDLVIVSIHAGREFQHFPPPHIQQLYRQYIDFGADIIIGHHPHIPQGIEHYKTGIIAYSLGDFMFEYSGDHGTRATFALGVELGKKGVHAVQLIPIKKSPQGKMKLLCGSEKKTFIEHIKMISMPLYDRKILAAYFEQGVLRHFESFYRTYLKKNLKKTAPDNKEGRFAAAFMYNMFDCPSHRESLKAVFKSIYTGQYQLDETIQNQLSLFYQTMENIGQQSPLEPWGTRLPLYKRIARKIKKRFLANDF